MFFPHRRHNHAVRRVEEILPVRYHEEPPPRRTHPWQLRPVWRPRFRTERLDDRLITEGEWTVAVEPGMVNGFPAVIRMAFEDAPPMAVERIRLEEQAVRRRRPRRYDRFAVFLDEGAALSLVWRPVGQRGLESTANPSEAVPDFFRLQGVRGPREPGRGPVLDPQGLPLPVRFLAASDIVLSQPRPVLESTILVQPSTETTQVTFRSAITVTAEGSPRVVSTIKYIDQSNAPVSAADLVSRRFTDLPEDQALLATVYALSPPEPDSDQPRGDWTLFVRQFIHYNLVHASRIELSGQPLPDVVTTVLGGLVGQQLNEALLNISEFTQGITALFNDARPFGRFYAV